MYIENKMSFTKLRKDILRKSKDILIVFLRKITGTTLGTQIRILHQIQLRTYIRVNRRLFSFKLIGNKGGIYF